MTNKEREKIITLFPILSHALLEIREEAYSAELAKERQFNNCPICSLASWRCSSYPENHRPDQIGMLAFEILDQHHDTGASIRKVIKSAFLSPHKRDGNEAAHSIKSHQEKPDLLPLLPFIIFAPPNKTIP